MGQQSCVGYKNLAGQTGEIDVNGSVKSTQRSFSFAVAGDTQDAPSAFARILEHIDIGIVVLDLECRKIIYQNALFTELLKGDPSGIDYQFIFRFLLKPFERDASFCQKMYANRQVENQGRLLGYSVYRPDGRHRCIFVRDITEKARFESIARAVNTMDNIGFIFSAIRHEIGNPVNSLKMGLSVLKENLDTYSREEISAYVDRGLSDIGRMEYLLNALKSFSLHDSVRIVDVSMTDFLKAFLCLVEKTFHARGIRLVFEPLSEDYRVRMDERALHQALLNVFNNAAEALDGRPSPQVSVCVDSVGQLVRLTVRDNGCGIDHDRKRRLFQPFNTSKPSGNGLGLVISRKLLSMMHSDIDIKSEQNVGTKVVIRLPVSPVKEAI